MPEQISSHFLTIDLMSVIVERHQEEGRECVCFFLSLPFGIAPCVGPQRFAFEAAVPLERAAYVIARA